MTFRSRLQRFPKSVTPFWGRNRCDLKWKADSSVPGSALALCIALSLACGLPVKSLAGTLCESSAVEDYLPPLPHGCQRKRIEAAGDISNKNVVILEDVTTTGDSAMHAVNAARGAGANVVLVLSMVDRGEGASEFFRQQGIPFDWLFRVSEFQS